MTDNEPKYIEGVGWRYETIHSMHRRMHDHDYYTRSIYMITMSVEDRQQLLGELRCTTADASDAHIVPSTLGREVERCWMSINAYYPEAKPLTIQLMPDHIHALLFVKREMASHLGQIINGFKVGCNKAYRRLLQEHNPGEPPTDSPSEGLFPDKGTERGSGGKSLHLSWREGDSARRP